MAEQYICPQGPGDTKKQDFTQTEVFVRKETKDEEKTEKYSDGTTKKVEVALNNKGTINEQVMGLTFYNTAGEKVKQISFDGFYVG